MSISKNKISTSMSSELLISKDDSAKILNSFLSLIIKNSKISKVKIHGFGTFYTKKTLKRIGRNPKTKESYIIESRNKLCLKTSSKLKKEIN
ncbi:HU family DNA-binding protein [Gammaproteobacteria bacterium]|nr:HU family DNA-binding protein [Gammaproteobacteria bacterium]